jgi:hypothetical protein
MVYIVMSKNGSNHKKIEGVFQDEKTAMIYLEKLLGENRGKKFFIEHHQFKDWCPEISKFVLSGR